MFGHKLKTVALAGIVLALIGAAEPVKVEFQGWFSNPVFSADGKTLVFVRLETLPIGARTAPSQIILWDVSAGKEKRRIEGPADDSLLGPIALSPDGKRLALGMWNTAVRLWDLEKGKEVGRVEKSNGARPVRFAPDGRTLGWLKNDEISLTDATTAKELRHFGKEANRQLSTLAFVEDGKTVLAVSAVGTNAGGVGKIRSRRYEVSCWSYEAATGMKIRQVGDTVTETRTGFQGPPVLELFVSGDGKSVLLAGEHVVQVCNWSTGKKKRDVPIPWKTAADDPLKRLALSADGQVAAFTTARGAVGVWDLAAGKELRRIETGHYLDHLALSPDGKRVAVSHQTPGRVGAVLLIHETGH